MRDQQERDQAVVAMSDIRFRLIRSDDVPARNGLGEAFVFGLQDTRGGIVPGARRADGTRVFDFDLRVKQGQNGRPIFMGTFASGPVDDRFVYLSWRATPGGAYINRVKARLAGLDWALIREAQASGRRLVADMTGWRPGDPRKQVGWALDDERGVRVIRIDHVQLAMPPGREGEARAFYQGVLGIPEVPKPGHLAARGGCWFESGPLKVHLGVEAAFVPARKAHPAFLVENLRALTVILEQAGHRVVEDQPLDGYQRRYVDDPFGNRLEVMEADG